MRASGNMEDLFKLKLKPGTLSLLPTYHQLMPVTCQSSKSREVPFAHEWGITMVSLQEGLKNEDQ